MMIRIFIAALAALMISAPIAVDADATKTEEKTTVREWTQEQNEEAEYIAKTLYGECRGCTKTEQAAVVWCILNRVDSKERYFPNDIISVITQKYQFAGYRAKNPVTEPLLEMAYDVMDRWLREKDGGKNVGRVLPAGYCFFVGDGKHNYFTEEWRGKNYWDWSLESPYEN